MACVKLHSLLQTVLCLSWEEVCFLLGHLGAPLWPVGSKDCSDDNRSSEIFSQLVPIVRTLLDQHADPVSLQSLLPNLPPTNGSPSFAQDLQAFCHTVEWQSFYQHQVQWGTGGPHQYRVLPLGALTRYSQALGSFTSTGHYHWGPSPSTTLPLGTLTSTGHYHCSTSVTCSHLPS